MSEPRDLLKERWYLVGPPWGVHDFIRAGAEDAQGAYVCSIDDMVYESEAERQHGRVILAYIVGLHNSRLLRVSQVAAQAARAEEALDRLQNAYEVLFEAYQREMDRLYALMGAARAYRDAVRAVDGIVDAEAALLAMVDQLVPPEVVHA